MEEKRNKYLQIRRIWKKLLELEQVGYETGIDEELLEAIFDIRQDALQLQKDILEDMTNQQLAELRKKEFGV